MNNTKTLGKYGCLKVLCLKNGFPEAQKLDISVEPR